MLSKEERKVLNQRFWTQFDEFCETIPDLAGRKKKWILHDTKISHIDLKFDLSGKSAIVTLEINHKSENRRFQVYELVERYRTLLNQDFEEELTWDLCYRNSNNQEVCRIYSEKQEINIYLIEDWPLIFQFLAEQMLILQHNFLEIQEYLQEDINALNRDL
jgi:hypothetical protein